MKINERKDNKKLKLTKDAKKYKRKIKFLKLILKITNSDEIKNKLKSLLNMHHNRYQQINDYTKDKLFVVYNISFRDDMLILHNKWGSKMMWMDLTHFKIDESIIIIDNLLILNNSDINFFTIGNIEIYDKLLMYNTI